MTTPNVARVLEVIEVELPGLTQYWSTEGVLLAERDTAPPPMTFEYTGNLDALTAVQLKAKQQYDAIARASASLPEDEAAAVRRSTKDHYEAQTRAAALAVDPIRADRDRQWHEQLELASRSLYDADKTKVDPPPRDPSDYLRLRQWLSQLQTAIFFPPREGPAP